MKRLLIIFLFALQQTISIGQVNVFIGKTKAQIKDFWSTKISSIYFKDTENDVFIIMVGDVGVPAFQAVFNEKHKCTSHQTEISFKDISVMLARLKKAGYKHEEKTDTWIDPTKKISAKINHYGLKDYYSFDFETISNEKAMPTKKTSEELVAEKEELKKVTDFTKNLFGDKATCSVITKKGNCCGYECNEFVYTLNDGTKNVFLVSTFDGASCDGKEMVTAEVISSNKHDKASSLEMMFEKLKKESENSKVNSGPTKANDTKPETVTETKPQKEVFTIVEQMPEFPGGIAEMSKYINKNLKYPASAKDAGITGKCFTKFVVNSDGTIEDVTILKGVSGCKECDEEAIRLIKAMPTWTAGKQNGRPVAAYKNLPITFRLN